MAERARVDQYAALVQALESVGLKAVGSHQEEDFLAHMADTLRRQVGCDVVIVRLLERYIQTRVVATADAVDILAPDELMEPFSEDDQQSWLSLKDGTFCTDIRNSPHIKPAFRRHALRLGIQSGFTAPLIRDHEICGQIVFGWKYVPELDTATRTWLRKLSDYACLMTTVFYLRKAAECDALTGLLNRSGLCRRWEVCQRAPQGVLLYADVDGLQSLTHQRGRLAADDLLRQTAQALRRACDSRAILSRYGRDEFVVVVPGMERRDANRLHMAIMREFRALAARSHGLSLGLTIGMAAWPEDGMGFNNLIERADRRMYEKKWRRIASYLTRRADRTGWLPEGLVRSWLAESPDGVIVTDPDQKVIYINPAYRRMTGYALEEWLGKRPSLVASGKTPAEVYEEMWYHLQLEGAWVGRVINRRRSGEEWTSYLSITRLVDDKGTVVGYMGIAREITG